MCKIIEEMKEEVREKALKEGLEQGSNRMTAELRRLGGSEYLRAKAAAAAKAQ